MVGIRELIGALIRAEDDAVIINTIFEMVKLNDIPKTYQPLYKCVQIAWNHYHLTEPVGVHKTILDAYCDNEKHLKQVLRIFIDCDNSVDGTLFWRHHLGIVLQQIRQEKLKLLGLEMADPKLEIDEIRQRINEIETIYSLGEERNITSIMCDYIQTINNDINDGGRSRVKTGFAMDRHLSGGLRPGDYMLLAARPGVGKSAFANSIILNVLNQGKRVLLVNAEMDEQSILNRFVAKLTGIDSKLLNMPERLTDDQLERVMRASDEIVKLPLSLQCLNMTTIPHVENYAAKMRDSGKPFDLIVLDYLQLFQATGKETKSKYEEVSRLSWQIKMLGANMRCPVIAISQLNRELEKRTNKRPILSDLRDSGSLEQDASIIAFIYRDEMYNADTDDLNVAEINIAKCRNGTTGMDKYLYDLAIMKFENLDTHHTEPAGMAWIHK